MRNKRNVIAGILAVVCLITIGSLSYLDYKKNNAVVRVDNHEESILDAAAEVIVPVQVETIPESTEEEVPEPVEEEVPELMGWQLFDEGIEVGAPTDYKPEEVSALIKELAKEDERYQVIADHYGSYPYHLIKDLVNNPEMLSFVLGYPGDEVTETEILEAELEQKCPLFLQWDPRWGYEEYGSGTTIAVSGCGPTALAMVATGLTGEAVSPSEVAAFALEKGYRILGSGTTWSLMSRGSKQFGLVPKEISLSEQNLREELADGKLIIVSVRKGDFTLNGHYMVIRDCDEDGFYINDPMCIYKSKQVWAYEDIKGQLKGAWSFKAADEESQEESEELIDTSKDLETDDADLEG